MSQMFDGFDYDGDIYNGKLINTKEDHNNVFGRKNAKVWDVIIDEHANAGDLEFLRSLASIFCGGSEETNG